MQKVRRYSNELRLLVGMPFQELFTPLPGYFFTFPSRYSLLSITPLYLGLEGGSPIFPQFNPWYSLMYST